MGYDVSRNSDGSYTHTFTPVAPSRARMPLQARLYEEKKRVIVHDGTRWRRVGDPWVIEATRDATLQKTLAISDPRWKPPELRVTLTAPGFDHVPIELTRVTSWRRLLSVGLGQRLA